MKINILFLMFILSSAMSLNAQADCSVGVFEDEYRFDSPLYKILAKKLANHKIDIDYIDSHSVRNGQILGKIPKKDLYIDRNYTVVHESSHRVAFDVALTLYSKKLDEICFSKPLSRTLEGTDKQSFYQVKSPDKNLERRSSLKHKTDLDETNIDRFILDIETECSKSGRL